VSDKYREAILVGSGDGAFVTDQYEFLALAKSGKLDHKEGFFLTPEQLEAVRGQGASAAADHFEACMRKCGGVMMTQEVLEACEEARALPTPTATSMRDEVLEEVMAEFRKKNCALAIHCNDCSCEVKRTIKALKTGGEV
jgi:cytosine/adenosine deaminase-related metal-dependent hydrolase